MPITPDTYERVALEDDLITWELYDGCLREKPPMTMEHGFACYRLQGALTRQLSDDEFLVSVNSARLLYGGDDYYVPDVCVLPMELFRRTLVERAGHLEVYAEPVPFVAEVWSPSTGQYDVLTKLADYQRRGDAEIWLIHPYQRRVTAWRRQPEGGYTETVFTEGTVRLHVLTQVVIDIARLFG